MPPSVGRTGAPRAGAGVEPQEPSMSTKVIIETSKGVTRLENVPFPA